MFIYIWCEANSVIIFGSLEMLLGQNQYFLFLKQVSYKKKSAAPFYFLAAPKKIWLSYAICLFSKLSPNICIFYSIHLAAASKRLLSASTFP